MGRDKIGGTLLAALITRDALIFSVAAVFSAVSPNFHCFQLPFDSTRSP